MQAAIGAAQLKKLPEFIRKRVEHFTFLKEGLQKVQDKILLPEAAPHTRPSWFGFPITVKEGLERNRITQFLEKNGIQTRLLFAGNLICHPCFDAMRETGEGYRVVGDLENTNRILRDTFWLGVYPGLSRPQLEKLLHTLEEALK